MTKISSIQTKVLAAVTVFMAACSGGQTATSPAATTTTATSPGSVTFASSLAAGGASGHQFIAAQAGIVTLTLTSVTPAATVGLGVGVTDGTALTCSLSRSVDATATSDSVPQLSIAVDPGTYCAQVFDPGGLPAPSVLFSLTINHP